MITVFRPLPVRFQQLLVQGFAVGLLSTVGSLLELVPTVQPGSFQLSFGTTAYAQDVSNQEVQSYARSVLAMEPIRVAAYGRIQQITGSQEVPAVACHRPSSLSDLPDNIRQIAIDYCNQAIAIVESNNLTITRFNQITVAHQSDPDLSSRIQQAINQLQSTGGP